MVADAAKNIEEVSRKQILLYGGQEGLISGLEETLKILPFKAIESNFFITKELKRTHAQVSQIEAVREKLGVEGLSELLRTPEGRIDLGSQYFPQVDGIFTFGGAGPQDIFFSGKYFKTSLQKSLSLEHPNSLLTGRPYQMFMNEDYIRQEMARANLTPGFIDELNADFLQFGRGLSKADFVRGVSIPCNVEIGGETYVIGNICLNMLDKSKLRIKDDEPVPEDLVMQAYELMQGLTFPLAAVADSVIGKYLFENEQKARKQLEQTQAQLVLSESMAGLGRLATGVAHEIGNPLSAISQTSADLVRYMAKVRESVHDTVYHMVDRQDDVARVFMEYYDAATSNPQPRTRDEIKAFMQAREIKYKPRVAENYAKLGLSDQQMDMIMSFSERYGIVGDALMNVLVVGYQLTTRTDVINAAAQRTLPILEAFKSFAKHEQTTYQRENLNQGLQETALILNNEAAQKGLTLETKLGELPEVYCNGGQLNQVWLNVMKNAIESAYDASTITIESYVDNGHVGVRITNQGDPIEEPEKLFDPFYTTKRTGSGLGLNISYKIIQDHRGEILGESMNGYTTFTMRIPIEVQK